MIAQIAGRLVHKALDAVEIMTEGGVAYHIAIPLGTYESLPRVGEPAALHTHLVVKDDGWQLYGFATTYEKRVFQRVLGAKGIGPAVALGLLSTLTAERLVQALRMKDLVTLQRVPRVGRKKAEQLVLDVADKLDDLASEPASGVRPAGAGGDDAIRALTSLGYTPAAAEQAVRAAVDDGTDGTNVPELVRAALTRIGAR